MDYEQFDWGTIHHCKFYDEPKSPTALIFLRFCNTDVHKKLIAKLNGIEWPKAINRIRLQIKNNATQTDPVMI
ncbi:unnamed protein product [Brachionus calyciflorus]|uniref:Uncharacterized protein n=1 Tax=Brachionus calyciflorus TaxID=104777 RepID=A0A814CQL1_9BILA|nr:unnamed protein product [Brachionus calyciflorus]